MTTLKNGPGRRGKYIFNSVCALSVSIPLSGAKENTIIENFETKKSSSTRN